MRPAPAVPDLIQLQYEVLQQCMLLLRRAHLTGRPDGPVKALASAGLVDMDKVFYRDVLADLTGIGPWLHYMEVKTVDHVMIWDRCLQFRYSTRGWWRGSIC